MAHNKRWEALGLVIRKKPALMMLNLLRNSGMYASNLSKTTDCTYSHVVKLLTKFENQGFVNLEKQGRLKIITLTKKGREVAMCVDNLIKIFS